MSVTFYPKNEDKRLPANKTAYARTLKPPIQYQKKSWGTFQVLDLDTESMTIKITLNPECQMCYHSHDYRNEIWVILPGSGNVIVDGLKERVTSGDVISIEAQCKHTIIAKTQMQMVEIQMGKRIDVHDKIKYKLED